MAVGLELLAVPFPEMVEKLALAIAQAQLALDTTSFRLAQMMSGEDYDEEFVNEKGEAATRTVKGKKVSFAGQQYSLLELGFTPTFYQFTETVIEVKISISITSSSEHTSTSSSFRASTKGSVGFFSAKASVSASSVSASYASKYQYSAEGSSLIRTKLVPVPPPAILEERIQRLLEAKK
jgi:hypothetical protein